ncbi:MAG: hypothetical protein KC912_00905 [Proteobacteria bacterium]|nr:hypothetical protein [Pseudomonadota bacterium]
MSTHDAIQRLAGDLREAMAQIQAEHRRLADRPTLTGSGSLGEATARRDRLVSEIGRVVADALLANEAIHFEEVEGAPATAAPAVEPARYTTPAAPASVGTRYVARRAATRRPFDAVDPKVLGTFIEELGGTDDLETIQEFDQRYQRLRYAASHPNRWSVMPPKAQRHLIGATVALLRDLQEANEEFGRPLREPEIVGLVSRLSHWSKEHRPGWVNGMARGAVPDEGEWLADAQMHIAELEALMGHADAAPAPTPAPSFEPTPATEEPGEGDPIERTCPACGATPGNRCQTDSGRKLYSYHHKERR